MTLSHEPGHDDQLVRYLLGLLPGEDAERLDELTVWDDEMAWRLRIVENDLVDAYVAGALTGQTLEQFESFYLSSERRRRKVRFARGFLAAIERNADTAAIHGGRDSNRAEAPSSQPSRIRPRRAAWRLAAAAALFLLACGALYDGVRVHRALSGTRRVSGALANRAHDLEQQLNDQRVANAGVARELETVRVSRTTAAQKSPADQPADATDVTSRGVPMVALVLLPQTRAIGPVTTLAVPRAVDRIALELRLEPNDFPGYQVALRDPATSRIVWRSGRITARQADDVPTVSVIVPASVLKAQHYSLELDGLSAGGGAEVVGTYVFQMVRR